MMKLISFTVLFAVFSNAWGAVQQRNVCYFYDIVRHHGYITDYACELPEGTKLRDCNEIVPLNQNVADQLSKLKSGDRICVNGTIGGQGNLLNELLFVYSLAVKP